MYFILDLFVQMIRSKDLIKLLIINWLKFLNLSLKVDCIAGTNI